MEGTEASSSVIMSSCVQACKDGRLEDLKDALSKCDSQKINPFQERSPSLFHIASMTRECPLEILEELITVFRKLSKKSSRKGSGLIAFLRDSLTPEEGYTALHCACKSNNLKYVYVFVKELRFYGTEMPRSKSDIAYSCYTPFEVACRHNCQNVASFLLQKCISLYNDFSKGLIIAFHDVSKEFIKNICKSKINEVMARPVTIQTLNSLCLEEKFEIVKFCIKEKLCKQEGKQLMQMAVSHGQTFLMDFLLGLDDHETYIAPEKGGVNLMHIACSKQQLNSVKHLIKAHHEMMAVTKSNKGETPLFIAIHNDFKSIVECLKQALKLNPLHIFCIKKTYISKADKIEFEELNTVSFLQQDVCGNTPLHYACQSMIYYAIDILLLNPCLNLSLQNSNGDTPGHILIQQILLLTKKIKSVEAASLEARDNPKRKSKHLHECKKHCLSSLEEMTKHYSFNPTLLNAKKKSIIFILLTRSNYNVFSYHILEKVLKVAVRFYDGTLLSEDVLRIVTHFCNHDYYIPHKMKSTVQNNHQDSTKLFIKYISKLTAHDSFNSSVTDEKGNTCLHYAAASACPLLVTHLLKCHSKINFKNKAGLTPIQNVPRFFQVLKLIAVCDVYSLLIENGASADLEPIDKEGNTLLHLACTAKSSSLLKLITSHSTSLKSVLNDKNKKGNAPLHLLCYNAGKFVSVSCFEILLDFHEINVNLSSGSSKTPLSILTSHINHRKPIMYEGIKKSIILITNHHSFNSKLYLTHDYLQIWCQVGKADLFQKCLQYEKNINLVGSLNYFQQNLLHISCLNLSSEIVQCLLEFENAPELFLAHDYFKRTPFHSICWRVWVSREELDEQKVLETFTCMINYTINGHKLISKIINDEINGKTALDMICSPRHRLPIWESESLLKANYPLLNQLLKVPNLDEDSNSKISLKLADIQDIKINNHDITRAKYSEDILKLLSSDIHEEPEKLKQLSDFCDICSGNTTLHLACMLLKKEAVSILVSMTNVDIKRTNNQGQTCLHMIFDRCAPYYVYGFFQALLITSNDSNNLNEIFGILTSHSSELLCLKDKNGENCLHLACRASMLALVKRIIHDKPELVTQTNSEGSSPLHVACASADIYIVSFLLEQQSVNVCNLNKEKQTVFHIVAKRNEYKIFLLLKKHSTFHLDVLCKKNVAGDTCLHIICSDFYSNYEMILDTRNEAPHIINIENKNGETALHLCPELLLFQHQINNFNLTKKNSKHQNPIFVLLEKLKNLNLGHYLHFRKNLLPNYNDLTPSKCSEIWKQVIKVPSFKKCINQKNGEQRIILHFICANFNNDLALKETMIDSVLSISASSTAAIDGNFETPFHILARLDLRFFDKVCKKYSNIDLSTQDSDGNTPLHLLCSQHLFYTEDFPIDKLVTYDPENADFTNTSYENADVSIVNKEGNTALHMACSMNCPYYIKCFSRGLKNINLHNKEGKAPVHCLNYGRNSAFSSCWQVLSAHPSFDPNVTDKKQMTILHYQCASFNPDFSLIEYLLGHKAINLDLVTSNNHTCLDLAKANAMCNSEKISHLIDILVTNSCKIPFTEESSFSRFMKPHHGIYYRVHNANVCKFLLQTHHTIKSAPWLKVGDKENTALHLACQAVCPMVIGKLLKYCKKATSDFPVNLLNQTPLHALAIGIKEQVNFLKKKYEIFLRDYAERDVSFVQRKVKDLRKHDWRILLEFGINKQDDKGNTALHYACEAQSVVMLKILTSDISCKFNIRNNEDKLPITVAQESGNRSFYLKFLIKYFQSQGIGSKGAVDYYKTVLRDSVIPMTPVKCILTGPPGAGKTTLKNRLLGEKLSKSFSTGVSDSPQVIAVRNISSQNVSLLSSHMKWTPVDCRDQIEALLETVSSHAHTAIEKASIASVSHFSTKIISTEISKFSSAQNTDFQNKKHFKSNYNKWEKMQKAERKLKNYLELKNLEKQLKELRTLANSVPAKKSKNDPQKFTICDLEKNPFVRIIDTGGQPELHELLPAFVSGPAINLIVFDLQFDLQEEIPIYCRSETEGDSVPYKSCINHEEMILRSLSSIACLGYGNQMPSDKELDFLAYSTDPAAFLIGSHKDKVETKLINRRDKHLMSMIKKCDSDLQEIVKHYSETCLLYPINGLEKDSDEISTLRHCIFQVIETQFQPIEVPVTWLIFSIKLQVLVEKEFVDCVIDINECFEIAKKCGFEDNAQVKSALWFFHNVMGSVMYFPHIPELESKVILKLQVVFDSITKLITSCFIFKTVNKYAAQRFSDYGIFTQNNLEKALRHQRKFHFSAKEIIALLSHLHAIVAINDGEYLMPTALKPEPLSEAHQDTTSCPPPLLISFACGYTPVGIFGSLVTRLLSNVENNIECELANYTQQHRNKIVLSIGPCYDELILIARSRFLEINFKRKNDLHISVADVCRKVRLAIDESIKAVSKSFNYKWKAKHLFGFACGSVACNSLPVHPAICEVAIRSAKCVETNDLIELSDSQLIWFGNQQQEEVMEPEFIEDSLSEEIFQKPLEISDLNVVFKKLKDLNEWKELGLELGLQYPTLEEIEKDRRFVKDCKMEMLACWLRKKDDVKSPSWKQLIVVLCKMKETKIYKEIIKELRV